MAKTKTELLSEAKAAQLVPADTDPDSYTAEQLTDIVNPSDRAVWEGSASATEPQVAPDGHVNLSKADIEARDAAA